MGGDGPRFNQDRKITYWKCNPQSDGGAPLIGGGMDQGLNKGIGDNILRANDGGAL